MHWAFLWNRVLAWKGCHRPHHWRSRLTYLELESSRVPLRWICSPHLQTLLQFLSWLDLNVSYHCFGILREESYTPSFHTPMSCFWPGMRLLGKFGSSLNHLMNLNVCYLFLASPTSFCLCGWLWLSKFVLKQISSGILIDCVSWKARKREVHGESVDGQIVI